MKILDWFRSLVPLYVPRPQLAGVMEKELGLHIQLSQSVVAPGDSVVKAIVEPPPGREFGGRERLTEERPKGWAGEAFDGFWRDLRFSFRVLRKSPGFAVVTVLSLALAIGANAIVFGVVDGLVLRPLHVPQAESLWGTAYGDDSGFQSYPNYLDLRSRNHSFEDVAAYNFAFVSLDSGNNSMLSTGYETTGNYFDVLRMQPYLGRFFHSSDEHGPDSAPYVVLSYAYWHSRFQEDRKVSGRVVQLNKHPFTIIGVAPQGFMGTLVFVSPDFFVPIVNQAQLAGESTLNDRGNTHGIFETFGHLKPGVSAAQASADVNAIGASLQKTYPQLMRHKNSSLTHPGLASFGSSAHAFVGGLMLLSALILLAACADLGILFAAHVADRSRADALRLALGSSRIRILRQLLTEATLISLAGEGVGVIGSVALLRRLSIWQPFPGTPVHLPVSPDARILLVAIGLALLSGLLFGLVPLGQLLRAKPYQVVKAGSSDLFGRRLSIRDVLLVMQVAICAMLITASLVAVRGLMRSLHASHGFQPQNTLLFNINLTIAGYHKAGLLPIQKRIIEAMGSVPGVEQVGLVNDYPPLVYASAHRTSIFKDETMDLTPANAASMPYRYVVSPGYFEAAGTSLLGGRRFSWNDDDHSPRVAVVNAEFARRMFVDPANAVGKSFRIQDGTRVQVVGVVEDGKYLSLTEDPQPAIFLSFLQSPSSGAYVIVRSRRDPSQMAVAMRNKLRSVDPGLAADIETWQSLLGVVLFPSRMAAVSLGVLGIMAAILSITGIFGMSAHSVNRRLKELGIRMALGAQPGQILSTALGRALKLLLFGSLAGLLLGNMAGRVLSAIVYQASSHDPLVLAAVVVAMSLLGLLATWIPAQRALAVNPLILLREE